MERTSSNFKKLFVSILSIIMCLTLCIPSLAFAGTEGDNGRGDGNGDGNKWGWENMIAPGSEWNIDKSGDSYLTASSNGGAGGAYGNRTFDSSVYGKTYWAAYVSWQKASTSTNHQGGWVSQWATGNSGSFPDSNGNWVLSKGLNKFFYNNKDKLPDGNNFEYNNGTWGQANNCIFWRTSHKDWMNAVWIDGNKMYIPRTYKSSTTKITFVNNPDNPSDNFNDPTTTQEQRKHVYYDGRTEGTYEGITPPTGSDALNYNNKITIKTTKITRSITITALEKDLPEGNKITPEVENIFKNPSATYTKKGAPTESYEATPKATYTRDINYKGEIPENTQVTFRPFNLNRNTNLDNKGGMPDESTYAKTGDNGLESKFGDSGNLLKGYVDNKQNITDPNKGLQALDINNDTDFEVHFNNNSLGLDKYDWFTSPDPLAEGSWEWVSGSYANGRVGDMTDIPTGHSVGIYRFNLKMNTSITSELASLIYESTDEVTGDDPNGKTFDQSDRNNTFKGGDWIARFVKSGNYYTDNVWTSDKYWDARYKQSRFFEYGVKYSGTYNVNGINGAILVDNTTSPSPEPTHTGDEKVGTTSFYTNGYTTRGIYVGVNEKTYDQPIMTAHWDVKTLAGDTRK